MIQHPFIVLLPCRLSLAAHPIHSAQQYKYDLHAVIPLENRRDNNFSAGLGRAIAAARSAAPFRTLKVSSDNSTHTPDEVWFGP